MDTRDTMIMENENEFFMIVPILEIIHKIIQEGNKIEFCNVLHVRVHTLTNAHKKYINILYIFVLVGSKFSFGHVRLNSSEIT